MSPISAADPYSRKRVGVLDSEMAYVDTGAGDPIVFLHGNPTSSYLWRNIIPHVVGQRRCLAPDLVGMGDSGKSSSGTYRFVDHARYLDGWFDALGLTRNVVLVVHDWGSALGFHWARRHPDRVTGVAYMEAIVRPVTWQEWPETARKIFQAMRSPGGEEMVLQKNVFVERILPASVRPVTWQEWPETARKIFQAMRSPGGEEMVLQKNVFVERILPASVIRGLNTEEMERYRAPYREAGESRRPTLTWPREIPVDGEPADVAQIVREYGEWLAKSRVAKLFVNADPGSILVGPQRDFCRSWPNQQEVTVRGSHFIQEDSPDEIGRALAAFVLRR